MNNPLLKSHTLPPFASIETEHVTPAIETLVENAKTAIAKLLENNEELSWESLIAPIETLDDKINCAWSPVAHLNAVVNSEALRSAYEESEKLLTQYSTFVGQHSGLYEAYKGLRESTKFEQLDVAQKKTIDNAIRDFKLSGVALEEKRKHEFATIKTELSALTTQFSNNVLDATHGWYKHIIDESELSGLPEMLCEAAKSLAKNKGLEGYAFPLDIPVYLGVMTQSENPKLREEMYTAYSTRASTEGPTAGKWDNTELIVDILGLRQRLAKILGFDNYAELSIEPKMAETTEQVLNFLSELAEKTKPFAEKELQELKAFAKEEYGVKDIPVWDIPFYSEKLKLKKYSISQEALRPYFPIDTVLDGLFKVVNNLFSITVEEESEFEKWHDDVRYFKIIRNGKPVASFYLDLYAREHKRGGAWMADCRVRRKISEGVQLPVAFLVCNFTAPIGEKPALLTHEEVNTLFHEFGHGLHHMLTKIEVASVSGINGVAWDAVELPSQFMENYCWEREVLQFLSCHYETGEALPKDMLDNMIAAKNFQSAMQMLRQLEFATFDFRLHMESHLTTFPGVQALLDEVRREVSVIAPPTFNKFQNSFSHIFAGGYAAGYYSYKWAEVLSSDAYSLFEEQGIFNRETGQHYLSSILECGGSEDAMALFCRFRGRKPDSSALLRHSGLSG